MSDKAEVILAVEVRPVVMVEGERDGKTYQNFYTADCGETPHFWGVYVQKSDYLWEHRDDFDTREEAVEYARILQAEYDCEAVNFDDEDVEIDPEYIRLEIREAMCYHMDMYHLNNLIDDIDPDKLNKSEKAWAKEHISWDIIIRE